MSLVIEDGTGKADAESYATVTQLQARAAALGVTVSTKVSECEILLRKAMQKMQRGDEYQGYRVNRTQALDFPRVGIIINRFGYASGELPPQLVEAQIIFAIEAQSTNLLPTVKANAVGSVVEKTVGPITTRYAATTAPNALPIVSAAEEVLKPLLRAKGGSIPLYRS